MTAAPQFRIFVCVWIWMKCRVCLMRIYLLSTNTNTEMILHQDAKVEKLRCLDLTLVQCTLNSSHWISSHWQRDQITASFSYAKCNARYLWFTHYYFHCLANFLIRYGIRYIHFVNNTHLKQFLWRIQDLSGVCWIARHRPLPEVHDEYAMCIQTCTNKSSTSNSFNLFDLYAISTDFSLVECDKLACASIIKSYILLISYGIISK